MTPGQRRPPPVMTWPAPRAVPDPPSTRVPASTKAAAPSATSALVCRPAGCLRYCRSSPISAPSPSAARRPKTCWGISPDKGACLLVRLEDQLLHAPVQQLGDVQQVFRGAGDLVDPAELLELLAGLAKPAEHFADRKSVV